MKTIEQIVMKVARELYPSVMGELDDANIKSTGLIEVVKKSLEIWLAQQTPVAHVYISDIARSGELGTSAPAYPVPVGTAFNKSVPVFLAPPLQTVEQELADAFVLLWNSDDRAAWDKKAVEHFDALRAKVESGYLAPTAIPEVRTPKFDGFSDSDGDYWYESPDDFNLLDSVGALKVGDEYEVLAGWNSVEAKYRVTKVPDETSDDYEVECISHPNENVEPTALEGWISVEDKLPHTGDLCLICINGVRQNEVYTFDCADSGEYSSPYFWSRDDLDECPTMSPRDLWQPLPPPPGEKK